MMDSAKPALQLVAPAPRAPESSAPATDADHPPSNILERFQQFKIDHPAAAEYQLQSEEEAVEVLAAVIPTLRTMVADITIPEDRAAVLRTCNQYQAAIVRGQTIQLFRKMDATNQLYLAGIKITARKRWG